MRIAQVAPLYERVPPLLYGGTERVVSYLTEELIQFGHEVTLFASGDSITAANLIAPCPRALRLDKKCQDSLSYHVVMLDQLFRRSGDFDIVHFHIDYLHFPFSIRCGVPNVTTLHGRLDLPELVGVYRQFSGMPLVSISDSQRCPIPWANWQATVHHGLPLGLFSLQPQPGRYLAFLGRISPEKRVDRAIEIAQRSEVPLRIAAKVDRVDQEYFDEKIKPLLDHPLVEFIGEIGEKEKQDFLGGALALLFPIDWPEPFGLAMIEALACGTPVLAFRRGSVPEVIDEAQTGFIVDSVEQAVDAVRQIGNLDRAMCRQVFEKRFSAPRMASDYIAEYERLLSKRLPAALVH